MNEQFSTHEFGCISIGIRIHCLNWDIWSRHISLCKYEILSDPNVKMKKKSETKPFTLSVQQ